MRHKTVFRVHCPVPGPSRSDPPGVLPGKVDKICGGHGQGETPGPIPNPEAKALHGDGTAPERVWESSAPPLSHDTVPPGRAPWAPGGFLFFPRLHRIPSFRHSYLLIFIFIYIFIHSYSFIFIHSLPIRPSVLRGAPPARARRRRGTGPGGHGGLRGGPCMPPHGPRREVPNPRRGRGAPAGRPAAPGRAAENGAIRVRRRGGRAGKQGRPQGVVPSLYR